MNRHSTDLGSTKKLYHYACFTADQFYGFITLSRTLGRVAGNATEMIRAYEAATGRLSSQQQRAGGASFNSFDYSYTERGNVIAKREAVGTPLEREMTYAYEPVFNKLISITHYSGFETTYTYDGFGNILAETDLRGGVQSFSYDSAGLPLTSTDKNGNVTTTFYSLEGRLERMTDPSGTVTTCSSAAPLYQQRQFRRAAPVFISDFLSFS